MLSVEQAQSAGPSVVAIVGAVTGILALLWNVARSLHERARLRVAYYLYEESTPERSGPAARLSITNFGSLPAYVSDVGLAKHLPWPGRVPVLRSFSFRMLSRWWAGWVWRGKRVTQWRVRTDPELDGRLEPGEMKSGRFVTIVGGKPEPMNTAKIEHDVKAHQWAIVETGLRRSYAKVVDHASVAIPSEEMS